MMFLLTNNRIRPLIINPNEKINRILKMIFEAKWTLFFMSRTYYTRSCYSKQRSSTPLLSQILSYETQYYLAHWQ